MSKTSPLHIAAKVGSTECIAAILKLNPRISRLRDRPGLSAMAYALQLGEIGPIAAFLDSGVVKINQGQGKERMTPLGYAASQGNYELCEFLLERKARVLSKDKFKRTPLIMAVRNGHVKVASLLLQNGSDWNHADSSSNTPLHYAAGFGWKECIDLLIAHGANINANNSWKVTPITIAMLKNNIGIVYDLLKRKDIDVDGKDDQGRTILMLSMADLTESTCIEFTKHLLEKGADVNAKDINGKTCLHRLAEYRSQVYPQNNKDENLEQQARQLEDQNLKTMIELLIEHGIKIDEMDQDKRTAFEVALENNAIKILPLLTKKVSISRTPQLMHRFSRKIFDDRYKALLIELLEAEDELGTETMNVLDKQGFTPFLNYVKSFIEERQTLAGKISNILLYQEFKHKRATNKYEISNSDIFDFELPNNHRDPRFAAYNTWVNTRHQIENNLKRLNPGELQDMISKHFDSLIVEPFIALLKSLIEKGANPKATVDKLEFYRELDKHKQHLVLVQDQREGHQVVQDTVMQGEVMIDTGAQKSISQPVQVKSRVEVIAEQKYESFNSKKRQNKDKEDDNDPEKQKKKAMHAKVKEFYATKGFVPTFQKIGGKKVEIEYEKEYGLQNALHLIMRNPHPSVYRYIMDQGIPIDANDFKSRNPFTIAIDKWMLIHGKKEMNAEMQDLIQKGANFDQADQQGKTPFLKLYNAKRDEAAEILREKGANIMTISKSGVFALKIALIRRDDEEIKRLVNLGADINQTDQDGRNVLHFAINMSSATADATFETEQVLIDLGVNINAKDKLDRVPLHYAFVKIGKWQDSSQTDPIETISSMCAQKHLQIDVADKWMKTPLHYAAQRSATISSLYILGRGADLQKKDIYNNSPLGIALSRGHFNYGIILIQKNADVKVPVYKEFPKRLEKQWKEEKKQQKKLQGDVDMENDNADSEDSEEEHSIDSKSHRKLFQKKNAGMYNYDDYDDSEQNSDLYDSEEDYMEQNLMNNQNAFAFNNNAGSFGNFNAPQKKYAVAKKRVTATNFGAFGGSLFNNNEVQPDDDGIEPETPPKSTFRIAIQGSQQGIAYLILDNGYDYMLAMQDALDENKFQLFLTLISKTADDAIVQQKNDKGQNLFHILAKNSSNSHSQQHIIKRIYNTLKNRGVDCFESDKTGSNALHYAVQCEASDLVRMLIYDNIQVNQVNQEGHSPLSLALKGSNPPSLHDNHMYDTKPIFAMLIMAGADVNVVYPEKSFQKKKEKETDQEDDYRCSIMINYIRHNHHSMPVMMASLSYLVSKGARMDALDSLGLDTMVYAIKSNKVEFVQFLLDNKAVLNLKTDFKDPQGWSMMHHCVQPLCFGSFENVEILDKLYRCGYPLETTDSDGKQPLDLALQQDSQVMTRKICALLNISADQALRDFETSSKPEIVWAQPSYDFTDDAAALISEAEEKKAKEVFKKGDELNYVPLDVVLNGEKQYKVYYDQDKRPWDAYLTKVDLRNGPYGDFVFYKLQLVHDTNRDLYLVLTRYGRIGEQGMNQRSPFNDIEEAKKEFSTIYKQKSGNEWEQPDENFVSQPKKYTLVQVKYTNVKHTDYLAPLDYENCAKAEAILPKETENLVEVISNVTMYQRAISQVGINQDLLPISGLKRETIVKAKQILCDLRPVIDELLNLQKKGLQADYNEVSTLKGRISSISSEFFSLIPKKEMENEVIKPIQHIAELKKYFDLLDQLTNIEFSSRILLGALYRQYQFNPIQYIYESMNVSIKPLQIGDPECDLVRSYALNTNGSHQSMSYYQNFNIKNMRVYKIDRKGEKELFEPMKTLGNRKLLWHGSGMSNFLGILSQGLRIAPPEAPSTGYMFGKGVYFADMMAKSAQYSHGYKDSQLLLLCEVALGEQLELYHNEDVTATTLGTKYHSVKGMGQNGPDFKTNLVVAPQGYGIPLGKPIKYPDVPKEVQEKATQRYKKNNNIQANQPFFGFGFGNNTGYQLQNNEYIVYNTAQIRMRYIVEIDNN